MYFFYILLGILPSIIWLFYFLRKDVHPEPKGMVLKIFLYGMLSVSPILVFALGLRWLGFLEVIIESISLSIFFLIFYILFWAIAEEVVKYIVVRVKVLSDPEFDEPIDLMLYMIIAGLGFAAMENLLLFLRPGIFIEPFDPFWLFLLRFLGPTFLHALCSATVGFFLALSFLRQKKRFILLSTGLIIAGLLHGFYNFAIIRIEGTAKIYLVVLTLIVLALFVFWGFSKLKRLKSVCL